VSSPVPFQSPEQERSPRVAVLGEAPGRDEVKRGRPFVGRAGRLLREALDIAEVGADSVGYFNTVCCLPLARTDRKRPEIRAPFPDEQYACRENYLAQAEWLDPDYVLLCGSTPLKLFRPDLNVTSFAGRMLYRVRSNFLDPWEGREVEEGKPVILVSTFHPAWVLYEMGREEGRGKWWASEAGKKFLRPIQLLLRMMATRNPHVHWNETCHRCGTDEVARVDAFGVYECERHLTVGSAG
jgi:uracil-DNA glycosylase family 4